MMTILIFVVLLGLLVFVHELGHFLVARRNGIRVDEFGFGFPPRILGIVQVEATGKYRVVWGSKEMPVGRTVYSLNWIPLGGFVKISGEDGSGASDPESFGSKSAWVRIKVLAAGVVMNFLLAWVLISVVLMLGLPQPIDPSEHGQYPNARIQILSIAQGTPAEAMGLKMGDAIVSINGQKMTSLEQVSNAIASHKGQAISVDIDRFGQQVTLSGTPRTEYAPTEGALGISFSETAVVSYPWYEAFYRGAITTYDITVAILDAFGKMIGSLFGAEKAPLDVTGPVGIVYLTKQMSDLGLPYLLQFAALLSINLGIINILPIPALDGGRILFILIEKIKGSPVSRKLEGTIHQVGFILLLLLMLLVTMRDFSQFQILQKLGRLFS
ncbi:MAG: RIP metalloprotease RseP [Candidatus Moranbacteria bacterium]|jgi:regulator of sigma E protease|nr:RIP metalloprotease RseP [Candidatus Moranbacteria bacterium]